MKITAYPVRLPLRHTFRIARHAEDVSENFYVTVQWDGLLGVGEGAPSPRSGESVERGIAEVARAAVVLQEHPSPEAALAALPGLPVESLAARAALEMAFLDLWAKQQDKPLYQVLGIVPGPIPPTSFTLGIAAPEEIRRKVREAQPYRILKVKLGSRDDYAIVEVVRQLTDKPLRVDANEGWTPEQAAATIRWLEDKGVELVEQPLPAGNLAAMRWLRERVTLPLIADESSRVAADIPGLAGVFDGINIKLSKCGGLREALQMIRLARRHGLKVMLGCMIESSVGITAAAHLASLVDYVDLDGHLLLAEDPYEGVTLRDGTLLLPERPGLGVTPRAPSQ
ncbi:MAG: dipeptide epimerase [bacterium]|jgi:L-alanine-DL-glutamate epimerase-like enolase superfamily enzyme|nr:dipeptide epimerase [candidate division KSB1 bacterium]MDH7561037.1 dipeptide epimerase [bacterium]